MSSDKRTSRIAGVISGSARRGCCVWKRFRKVLLVEVECTLFFCVHDDDKIVSSNGSDVRDSVACVERVSRWDLCLPRITCDAPYLFLAVRLCERVIVLRGRHQPGARGGVKRIRRLHILFLREPVVEGADATHGTDAVVLLARRVAPSSCLFGGALVTPESVKDTTTTMRAHQ